MKFYVYRHIRLDSNIPFYVGKGYNRRAKKLSGRNRILSVFDVKGNIVWRGSDRELCSIKLNVPWQSITKNLNGLTKIISNKYHCKYEGFAHD